MSAMLKGLGLMGAGAYGYQAVQSNEVMGTVSRVVGAFDGGRPFSSAGTSTSSSVGGGGEQLKVLQGEVNRLHQLLSDVVKQKQPGYTVIHTGRSSWAIYVYPAVGAGLLYAYCRLRGISVFDLLYVSQNSMSQFKSTVTEGFTRIWDEVRKQKDELMAKLGMVGQKQEQLMQSQAAMDERLQQVGDSVDDVKVNTHNINHRVTKLDGKMTDMLDGMASVQSGVMLLCHTVSEVTNRIGMTNTRSSQALKGFLTSAPGMHGLPAAQAYLPLTAGHQQGAAHNVLGLNLLLDGAEGVQGSEGGAAGVDEAAPVASTAKVEVSARGAGGPPSFPKTVKPNAPSSLPFWGMSRGTAL